MMLGLSRALGSSHNTLTSKQTFLAINKCYQREGAPYRYRAKSRRFKTTEAGDEKSGHINAGPDEGILFLDSASPPGPFILGCH